MLGEKDAEYRRHPTKVRGRIYVYAAKTLDGVDREECKQNGFNENDLPRGVIVGTVEIVDCVKLEDCYKWVLARPKRLKRPRKPANHPQPVFFYPFGNE